MSIAEFLGNLEERMYALYLVSQKQLGLPIESGRARCRGTPSGYLNASGVRRG